MANDELCKFEQAFWTRGVEQCERALSPDAVMAFPDLTGIMTGPSIIDSLHHGPR